MTPRVDVCGKQLIKCAAAAPEDKTVHNAIRVRNQARDFIHFRLSGFRRTLRSNVRNIIPQLFFFNPVSSFFYVALFSYLQLPVTNMSGSGPGDRRDGADPGEE